MSDATMRQYDEAEMRKTLERIARLDREARAEEAEKQREWQGIENEKQREWQAKQNEKL